MTTHIIFVQLTASATPMTTTRLQDDLLQDFKEQKVMIYEQIQLFEPLAASLNKPAAQRLISKGSLIFFEIACYILCCGSVAFAVLSDRIYPFYLMAELRFKPQYNGLGWKSTALQFAFYGLMALIALLFYFVARALRGIRLKNDIINIAGKQIKALAGQHLKRRAAIEGIEQRHFMELPDVPIRPAKVNEVPNPGYSDD